MFYGPVYHRKKQVTDTIRVGHYVLTAAAEETLSEATRPHCCPWHCGNITQRTQKYGVLNISSVGCLWCKRFSHGDH